MNIQQNCEIFAREFEAYCAEHGQPDHIETMIVDMNGILRGKWIPGSSGAKLANGVMRMPISAYGANIHGEDVDGTGLGLTEGDPDGMGVPVPGTLKRAGWAKGNVAQVLISLSRDKQAIDRLDPREMLSALISRFEALSLKPVIATELEFYVFQRRENGTDAPIPPAHTPLAQTFDVDVCSRHREMLDEIVEASLAQGIPVDTMIAEYGPGQFEINFHHTDDVMAAADYAIQFRRLVRAVVAKHGLEAGFMAKPYAEHPGSGMHVHASLVDAKTGQNVMDADWAAANGQTLDANGLAPALSHALSGVIDHMAASMAIFAPHMNSFRRFQPGAFAPSSPDWGFDNRNAALRVPETKGVGARLEHRICGADVNPYMALVAILGAMLHGLEAKGDPGAPMDVSGVPTHATLPQDWGPAVTLFEASPFTRDVFGDYVVEVWAGLKREEIALLTTPISPAEFQAYLGRI